jgi:peptidoglycan/xylan/chitin deacetylase (PgdA/CDA1 family)
MPEYDIWETEQEIQASAERLAAAEGFDWYAVPNWYTAENMVAIRRRHEYRRRAMAAITPNLPAGHPWSTCA